MVNILMVIIVFILLVWAVGTLQRLITLKKYDKEIAPADYAHTAINLGMFIVPAIYSYFLGDLYSFTIGFVYTYALLTVGTIITTLLLADRIMRNPLDPNLLPIYAILYYGPITLVMFMIGIYLRNPFVMGASFALASSWAGYIAKIND